MRYFFHLHESHRYVADDEGLELEAAEEAQRVAVEGARSIIAGEALLGTLPLRTIMEVEGENGNRVIELAFRDAVHLDG